jgi:integrase
MLVAFNPREWHGKRLRAIVCTLLDCELRAEECLALRRIDVNMDNLLLRVTGKGDKERLIPFSYKLRKVLHQWCGEHEFQLVFPTEHGTRLGRRDVLRDVNKLCRKLGFEPPRRTIHALRHTLALNYIRMGGGEFRLQKALGHTTLAMTRKYVNLRYRFYPHCSRFCSCEKPPASTGIYRPQPGSRISLKRKHLKTGTLCARPETALGAVDPPCLFLFIFNNLQNHLVGP